MLYKLKSGEDPRILNPGLDAVGAFAELSPQQLFFVILVCDPSKDNPVRTLSGRDRRERAALLAGYKREADGKRLDRNARALVYGEIVRVEKAIEEFKNLHYDQHTHNKEALKKQIIEIREFLTGDKRVPLVEKGKIILDKQGKEIYITDQKALKLAVELGIKLPELEKALKDLESMEPVDTKFESDSVLAVSSEDLTPEEDTQEMSLIDRFHLQNKK